MKFGVPWNVKGVRPEARDTAREAARRSGMSVGEWLNNVIIEQASADDTGGYHRGGYPRDDNRQIHESIERLDRRLDHIIAQKNPYDSGYQPAPYAPAPSAPPQIDPWSTTIEQAIAEISARQNALDSGQTPASMPHHPSPPSAPYVHYAPPQSSPIPRWPVQDISGLERQLRHITEQIERLHRPRNSEDISALREELSEISAKLNDAVPQRTIEALEKEVRALAGKIEQSRVGGADPAAIGGVERGLAEVRDALRELRPAESVAGFDEAVRNLTFKIDQMGAAGHDPAFLQQLEAAIGALRGIVSHVASNESLSKLGDEMRGLSAKIDRVAVSAGGGSSEALSAIEQRIAALPEQIRAGSRPPEIPSRLEALLKNFTDRLDRGELTSGEQFALGTLEDRIVNLAAKLDASDARLNQLGAIERGLADLLVRVEELRGNGSGPARAAPAVPPMTVNELKRDMVQTQDSLEAVHGTVGDVVDRLAVLESEHRNSAPAPGPTPAAASESAASAPAMPMSAPAPVVSHDMRSIQPPSGPQGAPPAKPARPPARPRQPIDPNLPPDYPIEPGSGGPRASAAQRIAASEAALASASPMPSASTGSTNFIAAARRAAQAAAPADTPAAKPEETKAEKPRKSIGQKMRALIAGTGVILLVAGGIKAAMHVLESGAVPGVATLTALLDEPAGGERLPTRPRNRTQPENLAAAPSIPDRSIAGDTLAAIAENERPADVTGSISQTEPAETAPDNSLPAAAPSDTRLIAPEKLPAALRNAANAGDPAAAYEVAIRLSEGRGLQQNLEEAARWLDRAARAGLAPAQFRLGNMYEKGQGVKKSLDLARRLYLASANKGSAKAMHNLAVLHAEGIQGKPDYKSAGEWFRKAAERGVADSQYNLGILYARGIGVEQNFAESYKWFSLAAAQGDKESAKKRDDVGSRLDNQSLTAARLATQTFVAVPQPTEAIAVRTPEGGWDRAAAAPRPAKKPRAIEPMRITPS